MTHDWDESLAWVSTGTAMVLTAVERLDDPAYAEACLLPGWTRAHLLAHLAANADALGRLVAWATSGVPTPMYSSPDQRADDIERGAARPPGDLAQWVRTSAEWLDRAFGSMSPSALARPVVTAQGRTVPGSETAWMRAREVLVHAVDLGVGVRFADLPEGFLVQLRGEIRVKRAAEEIPPLAGDLPEVVAYLAGRPYAGVTRLDGSPAPLLGPWL